MNSRIWLVGLAGEPRVVEQPHIEGRHAHHAVARGKSRNISFGSNFGRKIMLAPDMSATLLATNSPWV